MDRKGRERIESKSTGRDRKEAGLDWKEKASAHPFGGERTPVLRSRSKGGKMKWTKGMMEWTMNGLGEKVSLILGGQDSLARIG